MPKKGLQFGGSSDAAILVRRRQTPPRTWGAGGLGQCRLMGAGVGGCVAQAVIKVVHHPCSSVVPLRLAHCVGVAPRVTLPCHGAWTIGGVWHVLGVADLLAKCCITWIVELDGAERPPAPGPTNTGRYSKGWPNEVVAPLPYQVPQFKPHLSRVASLCRQAPSLGLLPSDASRRVGGWW